MIPLVVKIQVALLIAMKVSHSLQILTTTTAMKSNWKLKEMKTRSCSKTV